MKAERYQQIEQLFHAALERKPEERAAFIEQACRGALVAKVRASTAKIMLRQFLDPCPYACDGIAPEDNQTPA